MNSSGVMDFAITAVSYCNSCSLRLVRGFGGTLLVDQEMSSLWTRFRQKEVFALFLLSSYLLFGLDRPFRLKSFVKAKAIENY